MLAGGGWGCFVADGWMDVSIPSTIGGCVKSIPAPPDRKHDESSKQANHERIDQIDQIASKKATTTPTRDT